MTLTLQAQLPARQLDVELEVADGERVAILGPNGAGKSSVLAVLAGLVRPDRGRAVLDGRVLFDVAGRRGSWLPPHDRGVALMAQDPLLFPHLSVADNVAFGPRSRGSRRQLSRRVARDWLDSVDALDLADSRPGQLSGGQAQRVAIARALAGDPRLVLLDEPMSALDVGAAPLLRQVLRRVLASRAAVIVTHDLLDALILADRVVVLDSGRVAEIGPTAQVLRHPRTTFTARIAGLNLVTGTATERGVRRDGLVLEGIPRTPLVPGEPAVAVFAPSAVSVFPSPPYGSPRNTLAVTITELEPREDQMRVRAVTGSGQLLSADVTLPVVAELGLEPGVAVYFSLKANAVTVYPA
ncbi:MAG TPA: ATP-binding cassette domain-containing protein [Propionibacteriaceae bacterium]|nr:ATP-binding cassette domain-containing protein [Propionibacteriaceae bacterium]